MDDIFPVRSGGSSGKSEENRMLDNVGGPNTIRTKIIQTPEGELMLRTRGGFPEFTLTKKEAVVTDRTFVRTFVFRHHGASTGVIANRSGSAMKVLLRDLAIDTPAYWVDWTARKGQGFWCDVFRLDGTTSKVNGTSVSSTVSTYRATRLPQVLGAAKPKPCAGDATRSTLFNGTVEIGLIGASQIGVDGSVKQFVSVSNPEKFILSYGGTAGCRIKKNGDFCFYGSQYDVVNTYYMTTVTTAWSVIRPSATSPYLSEVGHSTAKGTPPYPIAGTTYSVTPKGADDFVIAFSPVNSPSTSVGYAYAGSDLSIDYTSTITCDTTMLDKDVRYGEMTVGRAYENIVFNATADNVITSAAVGKLVSLSEVVNGKVLPVWVATPTISCSFAEGNVSRIYTGFSADHIYADIDEDVYLTFEVNATLNILETYTAVSGSLSASTVLHSAEVSCAYVFNIRGAKHYFPCDTPKAKYNHTPFLSPVLGVNSGLRFGSLGKPIFSPLYMGQGNCPFIAYTTKAEHGSGADQQTYIDLEITPVWEHRSTASLPGSYKFVPHNAISLLCLMLWAEPPLVVDYPGNQGTPEVRTLLACGMPFKVQFANGTKGVWQSKLGAGFTGYPSMEITRI